jgi:hypothetical protein
MSAGAAYARALGCWMTSTAAMLMVCTHCLARRLGPCVHQPLHAHTVRQVADAAYRAHAAMKPQACASYPGGPCARGFPLAQQHMLCYGVRLRRRRWLGCGPTRTARSSGWRAPCASTSARRAPPRSSWRRRRPWRRSCRRAAQAVGGKAGGVAWAEGGAAVGSLCERVLGTARSWRRGTAAGREALCVCGCAGPEGHAGPQDQGARAADDVRPAGRAPRAVWWGAPLPR